MKVLCTLPNASEKINGIRFVAHALLGMISEEVDADVAKTLASIKGYEIYNPGSEAAEAILEAARKRQAQTGGIVTTPAPTNPAPPATPAGTPQNPPPAAPAGTPAPSTGESKPAGTPEPTF